ncbi:MAG: DEAD/DEAH box helicase [Gammaproteobacteria bacterium]|nr:DEAD/DEAH box helicase [Gammaproteobacteria bacterium]
MSVVPTCFEELQLSNKLLQAVNDLGFKTPSPIQQQTIPWMLQKKDVIALAQTGTGKTAAFGLPILENLEVGQFVPQALVLAPTRELAIQVGAHIEALGCHLPGLRVSVICGGQDYRPQLKKLKDGAHIVVGTPGRILDHLQRGTLNLKQLRTLVLDEADEMLRMGFIEDVETVLQQLPEQRQIGLFSATMPSRIRQIAKSYLQDPVSVEIQTETATVKTIEQRFIFSGQGQKPDTLLRVLAVEDYQGMIVFVRTKTSTEEVAEALVAQGHRAMAIHGDISQALRERVISQFKQGTIDILVATDVAARGLDVERVTHVINYDMAHDCETYVHRIGRTGRAGRSGVTILFVTPRESRMLNMIERHTRQRIEKMAVPNNHTIQQAREKRFMQTMTARLHHQHLPEYQRLVEMYLREHPDVSAQDLAAVLALASQQDKPWVQQLPEIKAVSRSTREREPRSRYERGAKHRGRDGRESSRSFGKDQRAVPTDYQHELFRIDVGRVHGVKPGNIVGAIANEAGLQSRHITALKIHDDHSTVRLPKGMAKDVMHKLNKAWICGRQLNLTTVGV